MIFIHPGGFTEGDKKLVEGLDELPELLSRGYDVASLDYRLRVPFPAAVEDVKAAVRFVRGNADRYGIDADRIVAWGRSAGGYLAVMLGVTGPNDGFDGTGGTPGVSSRVSAVVDQFGPTDFGLPTSFAGLDDFLPASQRQSLLARASAVGYVKPGDPPFLIMHGDKDTVVPIVHSQTLQQRLTAAGISAQLVVVKNAEHNFARAGGDLSPSLTDIARDVGDFVDRQLTP